MRILSEIILPIMLAFALMLGGQSSFDSGSIYMHPGPAVISQQPEEPEAEEIVTEEPEATEELSEADKLVEDGMLMYLSENSAGAYNKFFSAYRLGSGKAAYYLGSMALTGEGTAQSSADAIRWFETACDLGYPDGYFGIACMYWDGSGVDADIEKSMELMNTGAEAGGRLCLEWLGDYYFFSDNEAVKDTQKAIGFYEKGAEIDDGYCLYMLAYCYLCGDEVEADYVKAMDYAQRGAALGRAECFALLGDAYLNAMGVEKDVLKAFDYYTKAADLGDAYSIAMLGDYYYYGYIETDFERAFQYYMAAAEYDYGYAQYSVGYAYIYGEGVDADRDEGIKWLRLAYENGMSYAGDELEELGEALTAEE